MKQHKIWGLRDKWSTQGTWEQKDKQSGVEQGLSEYGAHRTINCFSSREKLREESTEPRGEAGAHKDNNSDSNPKIKVLGPKQITKKKKKRKHSLCLL